MNAKVVLQKRESLKFLISSQEKIRKFYKYCLFLVILAFSTATIFYADQYIGAEGLKDPILFGWATSTLFLQIACFRTMLNGLSSLTTKISNYWIFIIIFSGYSALVYASNYFMNLQQYEDYFKVAYFYLGLYVLRFLLDLFKYFFEAHSNPILKTNLRFKAIIYFFILIVFIVFMAWFQPKFLSDFNYIDFNFFTTKGGIISSIFLGIFFSTWALALIIYLNSFTKILRAWIIFKSSSNLKTGVLPMVIATLIWFAKRIFYWRGDFYSYIYLAVVAGILIGFTLYMLLARNELKSNIVRSTVLLISLLLIWGVDLMFNQIFLNENLDKEANVFLAGLGTLYLLLIWFFIDFDASSFSTLMISISVICITDLLYAQGILKIMDISYVLIQLSITDFIITICILFCVLGLFYEAWRWSWIIRSINKIKIKESGVINI